MENLDKVVSNNFINEPNKNNIKSLYKVEDDKKQKIIFKPESDRFYQPLFIILVTVSFILLVIGLILNAYSFQTFEIINFFDVTTNSITHSVHFLLLKQSSALFISCAVILLIALIIRLIRALIYVSINKTVALKNIDSYLIYKFTNRFILYFAVTNLIITLALMAAADIAIINNFKHILTFVNAFSHFWFIASIFAIITASIFLTYLVSKTFHLLVKNIKSLYKKNNDDDYLLMIQRKQEESFIKWLLNTILIRLVIVAATILMIAFFFYGVNGISYWTFINTQTQLPISYVNLHLFFVQIWILFYITGSFISLVLIFASYDLIVSYSINNHEYKKQEKMKKERARIERINVKYQNKLNRKIETNI